jgi:hypothetical protein
MKVIFKKRILLYFGYVVEPIVEICRFIFYYSKIWQIRAIYFTKNLWMWWNQFFLEIEKSAKIHPKKKKNTMKFGGEESHTLGVGGSIPILFFEECPKLRPCLILTRWVWVDLL